MADETFYRGDIFTTLPDLELRCETDEADSFTELTNLELGKQNGKDGTIGTYKETEEPNLGELIFEEYKNAAQANLIESKHKIQGTGKHLFRGKAQIGTKKIKVTVFRG